MRKSLVSSVYMDRRPATRRERGWHAASTTSRFFWGEDVDMVRKGCGFTTTTQSGSVPLFMVADSWFMDPQQEGRTFLYTVCERFVSGAFLSWCFRCRVTRYGFGGGSCVGGGQRRRGVAGDIFRGHRVPRPGGGLPLGCRHRPKNHRWQTCDPSCSISG